MDFSSNQNIYLEDKVLGVIHDLRQNPYSFTGTSGILNDRFVLRYNEHLEEMILLIIRMF